MSIGFYLQNYTDRRGRKQLYVRVRANGQDFSHKTDFKLQPEHWEARTMRILSTAPFSREYNKKLADVKETAFSAYDAYRANLINFEEMRARIIGLNGETSLSTLLELYKAEKTEYTYKTYRSVVNTFKNAIGKEPEFKDISYTVLNRAIAYWKQRKTSATSINSYIKQLGTLKNDAHKRGLSKESFVRHKMYSQKVETRILETIDGQTMLEACQKAKTEKEFQSLLLYLLMFALRGMYALDIASMKPKEGMFTHLRHKTGERMELHGLQGVILSSFKSLNSTKVTRAHQKQIKESIGVSFKTARKTYDSYALLLDIDIQIRFYLLGQKERSIKKHYTNFEWDELQLKVTEAHHSVLNKFGFIKCLFLLYKALDKEVPEPIAVKMYEGEF